MAHRIILSFLTTLVALSTVQAQEKPIQIVHSRSVTLELRKSPLRKGLARLFEGTGIPIVVDDNVPDVPISGRWAAKPLWEAFSEVSRQLSSQNASRRDSGATPVWSR